VFVASLDPRIVPMLCLSRGPASRSSFSYSSPPPPPPLSAFVSATAAAVAAAPKSLFLSICLSPLPCPLPSAPGYCCHPYSPLPPAFCSSPSLRYTSVANAHRAPASPAPAALLAPATPLALAVAFAAAYVAADNAVSSALPMSTSFRFPAQTIPLSVAPSAAPLPP
jgi:hypothetical protein